MAVEGWRKRPWLVVSGYALSIAALLFAFAYLRVNYQSLQKAALAIDAWRVAAAVALFGIHLLINSLSFAWMCQAFGLRVETRRLATAWAASLLAKYVPGGVWQVVGRGILMARFGVGAKATAWTGLAEQLASLATCIAIGVGALSWALGAPFLGTVLLVLVLAILMLMAWWVRRRLGVRGNRSVLAFLSGYLAAMLPYAAAYSLLLAPPDLIRFIASLFLGTVAGVLALPVPGGLGVRESVVALIDPGMDANLLLAGLGVARICILCAEVISTVIGYVVLRVRRNK